VSVNDSVLSIMCVEVVFAKGFGRAGRLRGRGGVNSKMSCNCLNPRRRVWSKVVQSVEDGGTTHICSRPFILVSSLPRDAISCAMFDIVIGKQNFGKSGLQRCRKRKRAECGNARYVFGIWADSVTPQHGYSIIPSRAPARSSVNGIVALLPSNIIKVLYEYFNNRMQRRVEWGNIRYIPMIGLYFT
jgi:hypothetical protein